MTNAELKMFDSYDQEADLLVRYIRTMADRAIELEILEAGCGRNWPLKLEGIKYRLTGVDVDRDALDSRVNIVGDLHEAIVGDLRQLDLGDRKFDVIYNSFVLEHVKNADLVLKNLHKWLKPGGLLILRIPDRNTVFGFLTRNTPFWFHVAYYKYILGRRNAGKSGFGPYATYYDRVVSRDGIRAFCKSNGILIHEEYGLCSYQLEKSLGTRFVRVVAMMVSAMSLGGLPWKHNNLTYVLRK